MEETPPDTGLHLADASKQIAQRLLIICENRFELLMVEVQEERDRILGAVWLALGIVAFGLLTGITLTALIVVALWGHSPAIALLVLTAFYAAAAMLLCGRLLRLRHNWQTLEVTIEQLKKDRECLEKQMG